MPEEADQETENLEKRTVITSARRENAISSSLAAFFSEIFTWGGGEGTTTGGDWGM